MSRPRPSTRGRLSEWSAPSHVHHATQDATDPRRERPHRRRSEEHTSELQSQSNLVCRLLLEKKKKQHITVFSPNPRTPHVPPHMPTTPCPAPVAPLLTTTPQLPAARDPPHLSHTTPLAERTH